MVSEQLLQILVCPETHKKVQLADPSTVDRVNALIGSGSLRNRSGATVEEPVEQLLVVDGLQTAYPIRGGIPVMLIDESIALEVPS